VVFIVLSLRKARHATRELKPGETEVVFGCPALLAKERMSEAAG
jgi:hypothetical protein